VNGNRRRLIVTVPRAPGRHPAVLYMTGIGCFSQESLGLQGNEAKLLYGLTEAGFATMRVEKSSMGDSEGPPCNSPESDLRAEVAGYVAGLLALRGYPFVDPANVFVMGLSIGGIEAPIVAQQAPVKGVVVINTVAKPFLDYLQEARRRQYTLRDMPYDEIEDRLAIVARCNRALLVEHKDPDAIVGTEPACGEHIVYPAPTEYMRQWSAIAPAKEWKGVTAPVLVVRGGMDYVATDTDGAYLRDMINSFHPGHATLAAIPTMDHSLGHVDSMRESLEKAGSAPFEPLVLETVRGWLRRAAAG
jgi:pimeloyl-ACP methyl ester carboxylesterase